MHTSRVFGRCLVPAAAALIAVSMAVTVHGRDDLHILHPVPTANPANPPAPAVQPNRIADNFALFINITLCIIGVLTMLFSNDVVEREQLPAGE